MTRLLTLTLTIAALWLTSCNTTPQMCETYADLAHDATLVACNAAILLGQDSTQARITYRQSLTNALRNAPLDYVQSVRANIDALINSTDDPSKRMKLLAAHDELTNLMIHYHLNTSP